MLGRVRHPRASVTRDRPWSPLAAWCSLSWLRHAPWKEASVADSHRISSVRFSRAHAGDGLLGWVTFVIDNDLAISGVAVRRSLRGELVLSWPARKDAAGRLHHQVRPVDA